MKIYLEEIIEPWKPSERSKNMTDAKKKEIKNLLKRGSFKEIPKEEISPDGKKLSGRFLILLRSTFDGEIK